MHPLPSSEEAMIFTQWVGRLKEVDLTVRECCRTLCDAAREFTLRANQSTIQAQRAAWTSWLEGGPAAGLRRQHFMSRVATGWVPSP